MRAFDGTIHIKYSDQKLAKERTCEFPKCEHAAPHRAPRSPNDLRSYRWFCLNHVRQYNRAWNFFEGWSQKDIEHFQHDDLTGHRPTWPVYGKHTYKEKIEDLESVFYNFSRDWFAEYKNMDRDSNSSKENKNNKYMTTNKACATLNIKPGFDRVALRRQYMKLAKKYHPDLNGGSKKSEELLKSINQAYTYLLNEVT